MTVIAPGVCRHCRCTEERPCGYCRGVHGGCTWSTGDRLTCSNPVCVRAEDARVRAAREARPPSKYRGWGYGAIVADKRREQRARRRRKGRAA